MNKESDDYSEEETIARREAALKRMLATPHKPHSGVKLGKSKAKSDAKASPKKPGRPAKEKIEPQ
jgi:hypothetical protein